MMEKDISGKFSDGKMCKDEDNGNDDDDDDDDG